jgi:hypothetical protein
MRVQKNSVVFGWLTSITLLAVFGIAGARAQDYPPPVPSDPNAAPAPADPNAEVMTRGPVHEAYAVPIGSGQTAGVVVPRQPANPIEEVAPDMKPDGQNVSWIPGYWAWDDERRDFLWVSGVWRASPPNYRWMPGYWQEVPGQGYQRIAGYWMPDHLQETTYLPQPPQSVDNGPPSPAPAPNQFWVPGTWVWRGDVGRYVWQPGYWYAYQPDWVWVPATYAWTPSGWVYVPGYWDYPLARRGLVFSPVYFAHPVAYYHPAICLDAGAFSVSLFCRPAYGHYYFGDYYDDRYVSIGIHPWFYYNSPRVGYDPLFVYYRWYHVDRMGERDWDVHLVGWHDYYRMHPDMRPPRTWAAQQRLLASREGQMRPDIARLRMVGDVHVVARMPGASMRMAAVSSAERARIQQSARESVRAQAERRQAERSVAGGGARGPQKVSLSSMPSYKAAQATSGHPVGAAAPGGRGPVNPVRGNSTPGRTNPKEKEKKPQASLTPAFGPDLGVPGVPVYQPGRKPAAGPNAVVVKPNPQVRTVLKPDTSKMTPLEARRAEEEKRAQEKRAEEERAREKDKDKK